MAAVSKVPTVLLRNGRHMPLLGLGTFDWATIVGEKDNTEEAVEVAIDVGYRHIDTAYAYQNEAKIGEAVAKKIREGKIKREDLFITTKLHAQYLRKPLVAHCLEKSLSALKMTYVDMYLVHSPIAVKKSDPHLFPMVEGKVQTEDVDHLETWEGMEEVYNSGKVKAIGVCNYNRQQILRVFNHAKVKPMNLQIECHAYFPQFDMQEFCKERGIALTAHSPLGALWRMHATESQLHKSTMLNAMENPLIDIIAEKYNKTQAQIILRWLIQRGVCAIPKSSNPERIQENFDIFDFKLDADHFETMGNLGVNERQLVEGLHYQKSHPQYPFSETSS